MLECTQIDRLLEGRYVNRLMTCGDKVHAVNLFDSQAYEKIRQDRVRILSTKKIQLESDLLMLLSY